MFHTGHATCAGATTPALCCRLGMQSIFVDTPLLCGVSDLCKVMQR